MHLISTGSTRTSCMALIKEHVGFRKFRHDGGRAAGSCRNRFARAVPRQGPGGSIRRAIRASGLGWIGAGPRASAQGEHAFAGGRMRHQARKTRWPRWESIHGRVPDRGSGFAAAPQCFHKKSRHPRYRSERSHCRPGAISQAPGRFRPRYCRAEVRLLRHAGRYAAAPFLRRVPQACEARATWAALQTR